MIDHTINREIFDFHYGSEKVAEKMQKRLVNYYAYEFNQIIQRTIERQFASSEFYFCDKLEIDLGDIEEDAFEERGVFEKFEDALMQKLSEVKNSLSPQVPYEKIAEEVVRQFLLEGDVPWWINKSSEVIAIQPLVQLLINRAPGKLTAIIKQNTDTALVRLATLFTRSSNSDVAAFKSFLETAKKEGLSIEQTSLAITTDNLQSRRHVKPQLLHGNKITLHLQALEPDVLRKLEKILSKDIHSHPSTEKDAIIAAVIKHKRLLPAIKEMALFTNQETIKAMAWLLQKQRLSASADEKLRMYLSTLSVYALHWLYAETLRMQSSTELRRDEKNTSPDVSSHPISKNKESEVLKETAQQPSDDQLTNDESHIAERQEPPKEHAAKHRLSQRENDAPSDTYSRAASIAYLLEKLRLKQASAAVFDSYSDSGIRELASSFNKIEQDVAGKKMLAAFLLEHPYFFKFNFLKIITEGFAMSEPKDQQNESLQRTTERVKITDALFLELDTLYRKTEAVLQKLGENDLLILQDVLQKGSVTTKSEHQTIQKVLQLMPVKLLVLLQAFTMLSESSMASTIVVQSEAKQPSIEIIRESSSVEHLQHPGKQKIQINNAGICLIAAYLPSFFKNMHLLEGKKFKSISHAIQAMYLIAYLAEGTTKHKEYLLQFNKILTGFSVTDPVAHMPRLPSGYKKEADALLTSIIENWKALRNTSINGFRHSFLLRSGLITDNGDSWTLQVERRGHDVLIDSVPWSFNIIRFPWMQKPVIVEW